MSGSADPRAAELAATLARAGVVAADEEADELLAAADAAGGDVLRGLVERRVRGEPLAWITGRIDFDGLDVAVHSGVYVPRWQSVQLARRAGRRLPARGTAVDLCTGSGAIALTIGREAPAARVVATDLDARAVACARANGVDALYGDLFAPLPSELRAAVDVVVGVVPYVPTPALGLLPRDTLAFEAAAHYDGGPDGTSVLCRVVAEARDWLRPGGALLLEVGGDQAETLRPALAAAGYLALETWTDDEGDVRGLETTFTGGA